MLERIGLVCLVVVVTASGVQQGRGQQDFTVNCQVVRCP